MSPSPRMAPVSKICYVRLKQSQSTTMRFRFSTRSLPSKRPVIGRKSIFKFRSRSALELQSHSRAVFSNWYFRTILLLARVQRWAFSWSPLESINHYHKFANVPYCTNPTFSTITLERCFLSWPTGLPITSPRNSSKLNWRIPDQKTELEIKKRTHFLTRSVRFTAYIRWKMLKQM